MVQNANMECYLSEGVGRLFPSEHKLTMHGSARPAGPPPRALQRLHPLLIDTAVLYPHPRGAPWKRSLKDLAHEHLGRAIQQGHGTVGHDSEQDASVALELAMIKMQRGHDFCLPVRSLTPLPPDPHCALSEPPASRFLINPPLRVPTLRVRARGRALGRTSRPRPVRPSSATWAGHCRRGAADGACRWWGRARAACSGR
jgi:hypothetical protein